MQATCVRAWLCLDEASSRRSIYLLFTNLVLGPVDLDEREDFGDELPPRPLSHVHEETDVALQTSDGDVLHLMHVESTHQTCTLASNVAYAHLNEYSGFVHLYEIIL